MLTEHREKASPGKSPFCSWRDSRNRPFRRGSSRLVVPRPVVVPCSVLTAVASTTWAWQSCVSSNWQGLTIEIITGTRAMPRVVNGHICVQGPSINVCKWVFTTAYMYNTGIHKPWWVFTNAYMYHTGIDKPLMYVNGWSPPPPTCTKQWKHKPKPCHLHWQPLCHVLCNRHCMVLARVMHLTTL